MTSAISCTRTTPARPRDAEQGKRKQHDDRQGQTDIGGHAPTAAGAGASGRDETQVVVHEGDVGGLKSLPRSPGSGRSARTAASMPSPSLNEPTRPSDPLALRPSGHRQRPYDL